MPISHRGSQDWPTTSETPTEGSQSKDKLIFDETATQIDQSIGQVTVDLLNRNPNLPGPITVTCPIQIKSFRPDFGKYREKKIIPKKSISFVKKLTTIQFPNKQNKFSRHTTNHGNLHNMNKKALSIHRSKDMQNEKPTNSDGNDLDASITIKSIDSYLNNSPKT